MQGIFIVKYINEFSESCIANTGEHNIFVFTFDVIVTLTYIGDNLANYVNKFYKSKTGGSVFKNMSNIIEIYLVEYDWIYCMISEHKIMHISRILHNSK